MDELWVRGSPLFEKDVVDEVVIRLPWQKDHFRRIIERWMPQDEPAKWRFVGRIVNLERPGSEQRRESLKPLAHLFGISAYLGTPRFQ